MNRVRGRAAAIPTEDSATGAVLTVLPPHAPQSAEDATPSAVSRSGAVAALYALWILGLFALFSLHFPHLLADFPNHSPWMDYSKYTDEGWYSNAAIRHFVIGHWYLHGDFNPGVALPVWPLLLAGVFHFTGVSLAADRILALVFFGLDLVLAFLVVRTQAPRWAALLAVTLLATSPFLWAFSRLAILESPLICFLLVSWLLALRLPGRSARTQTVALAAIGVLVCLMILTKTTAIFVIPSTVFLVARASLEGSQRLRAVGRNVAMVAAAAAVPWCAYYFLLVRPYHRVDYQYFFDANHWPQPTTLLGWLGAVWWALHGALWISPTLCVATVVVFLLALFRKSSSAAGAHDERSDPRTLPGERAARRLGNEGGQKLWRDPVAAASLLTIAGYVVFIAWHNNPQPRYYQVVFYPVCFLFALGTARLLAGLRTTSLLHPALFGGAGALGLAVAVSIAGIVRIAGYFRHPEYSLVHAARGIAGYIDQHPGPHRLLLSISGDNIELMTGVPAICDDYGAWDLPYRIHTYQPGWFAEWNDIDPGTLSDIQSLDSLQPVASFPAFDDPDRNVLVLYRMVPLPPARQTYVEQTEMRDNSGK